MNHGRADPSPAALLFVSAAAFGIAESDGAEASGTSIVAAVYRAWPLLDR